MEFLNNRSYRLKLLPNKEIIIFGTTLWTHIPKDKLVAIECNMNDYSNIYYKDKNNVRKLKSLDVTMMNKKMTTSIKSLITRSKKKKENYIILTHHCPYIIGNHKNVIDYAYHNKLNDLIKNSPKNIKIWCYGHTHKSDNRTIGHMKIYSNPIGYPHEKKNIIYNSNFKINLLSIS